MARVAGVELSNEKHIVVALTAIFGIGKTRARKICDKAGLNYQMKTKDISHDKMDVLRKCLGEYTIEGDLKREVSMSIKRLIDMGCYRGGRHKRGLPVRGQRTRTNARTRKGPRKMVIRKAAAPAA